MTDIEKYMRDNAITQITDMGDPYVEGEDGNVYKLQTYSVVIGNNRYFGFTIAEAVEKAQ